jgi:antitoxin component YwqK of YwqJK toxin-antitoxin module
MKSVVLIFILFYLQCVNCYSQKVDTLFVDRGVKESVNGKNRGLKLFNRSRKIDTIYIDRRLRFSTPKKSLVMGILRNDSCMARVYFYYKSRYIVFSGGFNTCDSDKKTGPFYYYKKRGISTLELYEPYKYPEILTEFAGFLKNVPPQSDSLMLMIKYYNKKNIKHIGYANECGLYFGPHLTFFKNGYPRNLMTYENGKLNGPVIDYMYNGDGYNFTGNFKDNEPYGEWEYYDNDGKIRRTDIYRDGKLIKSIEAEKIR